MNNNDTKIDKCFYIYSLNCITRLFYCFLGFFLRVFLFLSLGLSICIWILTFFSDNVEASECFSVLSKLNFLE